jgi:hypothetical protein
VNPVDSIDPAVFRPATGTWYILKSSLGFRSFVQFSWGLGTDTPVPADYDGDGKTDLAVYRPTTGEFYVLAIYDPSLATWSIRLSGSGYTTSLMVNGGSYGDVPVSMASFPSGVPQIASNDARGDVDGDGRTDVAVFRPSTGAWYVLKSGGNYSSILTFTWGTLGDIALPTRP